jgi:hypothetical protein
VKKKLKFRERPPMGRIPLPPPNQAHTDKSKYNRKRKHRRDES